MEIRIFGILFLIGFVNCGRNFLPRLEPISVYKESCVSYLGDRGTCTYLHECPSLYQVIHIEKKVAFLDTICGKTSLGHYVVCCGNSAVPDVLQPIKQAPIDITAPKGPKTEIFPCGMTRLVLDGVDVRENYRGNSTATFFKRIHNTGIKPLEVEGNQLCAFEYREGSSTKTYLAGVRDPGAFFIAVVGGESADRVRATYMAVLGNGREWFCDGVIINRQWILTAAHCLDEKTVTVVRLGEYELKNDVISGHEAPIDFSVAQIVIHPDYKWPSSNHDLALIQLTEKYSLCRVDINPVCLPWDNEATLSHVKNKLTLTGWGATIFSGATSSILQEAEVEVFESSECDRSYSTLRDYKSSFPNGIRKDLFLCAGHREGGVDACQGDSGGPVVYKAQNGFTLAGIVSTGFGCGLKKFPGIYIPINNRSYLSWIKRVAFKTRRTGILG